MPFHREYQEESFHIYISLEGCSFIYPDKGRGIFLHKGEAIVVPASVRQLWIMPDEQAKLLETYVGCQE